MATFIAHQRYRLRNPARSAAAAPAPARTVKSGGVDAVSPRSSRLWAMFRQFQNVGTGECRAVAGAARRPEIATPPAALHLRTWAAAPGTAITDGMSIANIVFTDLVITRTMHDTGQHSDNVCAYDGLVFNAACRNDGDRTTRAFHVTFRLDDGREHSQRVQELSPGEEQWVQWEHEALPEGWHHIFVEFDVKERIRESDENDNSYQHEFYVYQGEAEAHSIDMEGETITVGPEVQQAGGWRQIDVTFIIRDALGAPLDGYAFLTRFFSPEKEETQGGQTLGDAELTTAGVLTCPNVWLKPQGSVRLEGIAIQGGVHDGGPLLDGVQWYTLADGATTLTFDVSPGRREFEIEASSEHEASETVKAEGNVGLELKIFKIGGGGGKEWGDSRKEGTVVKYKVILGEPVLTVTQTH